MARFTIKSDLFTTELDVKPHQDLFTCLIPALLAALPAFLDAFFKCIGGGGGTGGSFKPGERTRC